MSSATRKSSAGPGVDLGSGAPCIFQGAATPAWNYRRPRCRDCDCYKQNPPIRHHTRTMALSAP